MPSSNKEKILYHGRGYCSVLNFRDYNVLMAKPYQSPILLGWILYSTTTNIKIIFPFRKLQLDLTKSKTIKTKT